MPRQSGFHHSIGTKAKMSTSWSSIRRAELSAKTKGRRSGHWKGGRLFDSKGYVLIYSPNHPDANNRGYIQEHRLVMEEHLGRMLLHTEIVHHINGIKDDNRIENLALFSDSVSHTKHHRFLDLQGENQ